MDFLDKRVMGICKELEKLKVKNRLAVEKWKYKEGYFIDPEDV